MKKRFVQPTFTHLEFRLNIGLYRVWRNDWYGDQFEMLESQEFSQLQTFCKRFAIPLVEAED